MLTASIAGVIVIGVRAAAPDRPVRLARHPDYHAGKVTFSYLGDIWVANDDGSNVQRLTDNLAREDFPRFSPDGKWIAFSSNRYGNYDVFIVPATGGTPHRLTYHTGDDNVVGWTRDSTNVVFRASHGDGAFPTVANLYQISTEGGAEKPLPLDWGFWGSYSPDGRQFAFNRHPAVWSRQHYRGSYAADLWIADLRAGSYIKLLADERYNRYWPMWGYDGQIYFVGDPLPNDRNVVPGSAQVRKSVNNIYKVAASGNGQPVQVTKHTSGNLFWPSMSSDGKTIVYEEDFGIWKLDVASGKTSEIKLNIASDDKENELEVQNIRNEVDSFDISPSSQRAIISAHGQLFTIATSRGDITRVAPDNMASRNQSPKWSPDGKHIAFVSDRSGRDEVWISNPDSGELKKITNLDNEKGALAWTPDSSMLLYTAADKKLYSYAVNDAKTTTISTSDVSRIGNFSISPDSKWVALSKQDRTLRSHVYIAPIGGGEERHISDDRLMYAENNAVWTGDGRHLVFVSSESAGAGIASQSGVAASMDLWALPLKDQDRDPRNRDIDNEAQALAAEAANRPGGRGPNNGQPPQVQIDWDGIARRARRLTVPGNTINGLTPSPDGRSVAFNLGGGGGGGARGGAAAQATAGIYVINVESGQLTRIPPAPAGARGDGGGGGRGNGGGGGGGGASLAFSRDGRTLYFRSGTGLFAANVPAGGGNGGTAPAAAGNRGGRGGGAAAPESDNGDSPAPAANGATARQVTYSVNIEIDHRALRAQVFNEGWRIMKNRFYDEKMHGADWESARAIYSELLDNIVDEEELHTVMMMMIGQLNASHTGVSGGPPDAPRSPAQTRYPGFDLKLDGSGYYRIGHIYKTGPADHDYLKVRANDYVISIDGHELRTTDNYWQYFTLASGQKFHFMLNDKPGKDGAWEVTIEPINNTAFGDLQYAKWVDDRREMVTKLSNGDIGYLHIRAMDAPSLRQFQLDLAANRTKKALVIDQRFNGGGGIDQELLGILSGRAYQYTVGRDSPIHQSRPQNFYGPMVVMQNERSASDAEMFPAGFKALGLGKVIGVNTYGAVIGTGSYTLLDGSAIRTPGSGVWLTNGQNMENYGVPPDVYIDNTPSDFIKGRDAQIEKAVEVLKAQLAGK
jgi:tricorn protease